MLLPTLLAIKPVQKPPRCPTRRNAYRRQGVSALDALQFVQGLDSAQGANPANLVTQQNARAVRVDLGPEQAQTANDGSGLRSKCFVGLDHVQVRPKGWLFSAPVA